MADWYSDADKLVRWMRKKGVLAMNLTTHETSPVPGLVTITLGPKPVPTKGKVEVPTGKDREEAFEAYKKRTALAAVGGPREKQA